KDMPLAAVHFYAAAFRNNAELARNPKGTALSQAATAAVLAAAGHGKDTAKLDAAQRARLRRQALDWLREDLKLMTARCDNGTSPDRRLLLRRLKFRQS